MWVDVTENCSTPQPDGKRNPSEWLRPWTSPLTLIFIESYPPPPSSPILQVQSGSPLLEGNVQPRKENTTLYICAFYLSRMVLNTGIQRMNVLNKWAQWNLKPKEIYQSSTDETWASKDVIYHASTSPQVQILRKHIPATHWAQTNAIFNRSMQTWCLFVRMGLSFF